MSEPRMKREVAVSSYNKSFSVIYLYATPDAVDQLGKFGAIQKWDSYLGSDHYRLDIDARYDFDEVLAYIQNYGGAS